MISLIYYDYNYYCNSTDYVCLWKLYGDICCFVFHCGPSELTFYIQYLMNINNKNININTDLKGQLKAMNNSSSNSTNSSNSYKNIDEINLKSQILTKKTSNPQMKFNNL